MYNENITILLFYKAVRECHVSYSELFKNYIHDIICVIIKFAYILNMQYYPNNNLEIYISKDFFFPLMSIARFSDKRNNSC